MPEHLTFQQGFDQRRAIDRHEGRRGIGAGHMDGPRHKLLTGSRLAEDQRRDTALRDHADGFENLLHCAAASDNSAAGLAGIDDQTF